jgi:hypothetical protein
MIFYSKGGPADAARRAALAGFGKFCRVFTRH